tara:strand:+ start:11414 stop:11638 length:225 start_codon:yes stop_codon:yes gene_type:complete
MKDVVINRVKNEKILILIKLFKLLIPFKISFKKNIIKRKYIHRIKVRPICDATKVSLKIMKIRENNINDFTFSI